MISNYNDILGVVGRAIPIPEATNIKLSLIGLSRKLNVNVKFWGRIDGYHADYYIAQAQAQVIHTHTTTILDVTGRQTFFSIDGGLTWVPLPSASELSEEQREFCDLIRGPFMGKPEYEYKEKRPLPPDEVPEPAAPEEGGLEVPAEEEEMEENEENEEMEKHEAKSE